MSRLPSCFETPVGERERRYVHYLHVCDPPADAVGEAILAGRLDWSDVDEALQGGGTRDEALGVFVEALKPPFWFDEERARVGSRALQRTGPIGGVALALYCLPLGYLSPAGVKPLAASGRFVEAAPRRLYETNQFLLDVTTPDGLRRERAGFRSMARVRLMHAVVRTRLRRNWSVERWGEPINQAHMAGTNLLFSLHAVDGLEKLGVKWSEEEVDGYLHLWRRIGHGIGIHDELLATCESEARSLWSTIGRIEGEPDEDCGRLARALVGEAVPRALSSLVPFDLTRPGWTTLVFELSAALIGDEAAAALGYPHADSKSRLPSLIRRLLSTADSLRSPRSDALLCTIGDYLNRSLAEATLGDEPARFVA